MHFSILKTLAWFDIFGTPLTREELYRWLWQPKQKMSYSDFINELEQLPNWEYKDSFYTLPGQNEIIRQRQGKIPVIEKKLKIAERAVKKIRWIPFVEAVFIGNTVAAGTAGEDSDIDVFIVVKEGRLFLSRILVTFLLSAWKLRRTKTCVKDRVCLCFYSTSSNLNLSKIKLGEPDVYLAYWIDQLIPIYDPNGTHKKIIEANAWVKDYLPNALKTYSLLHRYKVEDNKLSRGFKRFFEIAWQSGYGDFLESEAKKIQMQKMKQNRDSVQNEDDSRVIVSDQMLKFHENDRRSQYREEWLHKIKQYETA